jgi:single-strand DNA-binding protein
MNTIHVIGRLGADAELINGKNGQFVSFRMASDERRNGEKVTSWFKVTLNGDRAAKLAEYLTKGKLVNVVGSETVGTYQAKDGTTQVSRDISASNIEFISVGNGQTAETTVTAEPTITTGKLADTKAPVVEKASKATVDDLPF